MPGTGRAVVTPGRKPVPLMVTFTSFPLAPTSGTTLVRVGAGFVTVNPPASVTPPAGLEFEIETSLTPVAAVKEIVMYARTCELLTTDTESAVIPLPKLMVVTPETKLEPLRSTMKAWPRTPELGETDTNAGSGITVKAFERVVSPPPGVGFETTTSRGPAVAPEEIASCAINI
jgi:hypothetical protein